MATMTTGFMLGIEPDNAVTRGAEYLMTVGSVATAGSVPIFASATASDDFYLTSLNVSFLAPTANGVFTSYVGTNTIATYPTLAADTPTVYSHSFPGVGITGVTTTTATVSIVGDAANTATVQFCATGWRKR